MNAGQPISGVRGRKRLARPSHGPGRENLLPAVAPDPGGAAAHAEQHDRVGLTVRIDRAMHARLRALAARQRRTHQDIVEGALDAYLTVFGAGCACSAGAKPNA
jgi:hypothetical protein